MSDNRAHSAMNDHFTLISQHLGERLVQSIHEENQNEIHVLLRVPEDTSTVCSILYQSLGYRLVTMVCSDERENEECFVIRYVFEHGAERQSEQEPQDVFVVVIAKVSQSADPKFPSLVSVIPGASVYEREIREMFGLIPVGNPDTRPLVLHEQWPEGAYPLRKEFDIKTKVARDKVKHQNYLTVEGEGICEIPVGPVHAGIIEPGHFRFSIIGENIVNLETRLFYTHKGVEKLAESMTLENALLLSERISGDEAVANSMAYCQAIEKIANVRISNKAMRTRSICAEMERIYNHLGTLAGISTDLGFAYGSSRLNILKERMMQLNEKIAGSRILFGVNKIGGVGIDILRHAEELQTSSISIRKDFDKVISMLRSKSSVIDRLRRTGIITKKVAADLQTVGIAARCTGIDVDTRRDHPYAAYLEMTVSGRGDTPKHRMAHRVEMQQRQGDAMARFDVRVEETIDSLATIQELSARIGKDDDTLVVPGVTERLEPFGNALGYAESHRGQTVHWLMIGKDTNSIFRYKVRTASFCNWPAIEAAVLKDIVPDFPLINKSLDLSYSGNDL
jgi:Ni,Fe-hydrogenase III large subunit/Ni,Fe-hydrogenase III component G